MGQRGPRPLPTQTKRRRGNPGKRPLNKNEPGFRKGTARPPAWLSRAAKQEWRRVHGELQRAGVLTLVDRAVLVVYVEAWSTYRYACEALRAAGADGSAAIQQTKTGYQNVSALFVLRKQAAAEMLKAAAELGITPSARSRIQVAEPERSDPYEEYRKRRAAMRPVRGGKR